MLRIAGTDIPSNKSVFIALTYIYGIGRKTSLKILRTLNINENIKVQDLSEEQLSVIRNEINILNEKGFLRREAPLMNIKLLMSINSYRGKRHILGLPARGQNTRNNAKTTRRNRQKNVLNFAKQNKSGKNIKRKGL
ncbi:30S ribosomal protein S13 [Candidatus Phytoplasma melaleucae]|uniref:Small ribosomal subunit protein uS13 n=1 Tax=Candidatus Phytoplasma melaleucae TaxID=2982630 RepID=A0ABT9DDI2_9MOLU|nr:30S ribosomal protein S13 ['Melaleuca sp.' phytoplasma]MDO8168103.1 30S ribosomal protein S13 ['Melaleuca sp.' phytoplasma]MDV3205269.1 30S ribosomal protein S13 [Weeping tea tree witches'-broom phytoplasma]